MKKQIKLSNNKVVMYDPSSHDGFDVIASFYEPKLRRMLFGWNGRIPFHDIDDMMQVCRLKLVDALLEYDETRNIQFSTYVYTAWHRKLAQMVYKYKSKKYSTSFDSNKNVSYNHAIDKQTKYQYLRHQKDKCPMKGGVINSDTCKGCPHFLKHKNKEMARGAEKGKKFRYSMCNFYIKIMEARGMREISLDKVFPNNNMMKSTLSDLIPCVRQKINLEEAMFNLELIKLRTSLDPVAFSIMELILEGYSKKDIMNIVKIKESKYDNCITKMQNNKELITILSKQGD